MYPIVIIRQTLTLFTEKILGFALLAVALKMIFCT